jgi:hypothetical protein
MEVMSFLSCSFFISEITKRILIKFGIWVPSKEWLTKFISGSHRSSIISELHKAQIKLVNIFKDGLSYRHSTSYTKVYPEVSGLSL